MGYKKITVFGNLTEVIEYEKDIRVPKRRSLSPLAKARAKAIREARKNKGLYQRSSRSVKRSREAFFRLCHHNNCLATSITFVTLTFAYDLTYKEALSYQRRFMDKIKSRSEKIPVSYISVPELTEKGRWHFHLLVYNLPPVLAGKRYDNAKFTSERATRNLQVLFQRGYVDTLPATSTSEGIAGYMAKYMAKALGDSRYEAGRGYNSSRNIAKVSSVANNQGYEFFDLMIPPISPLRTFEYDVPYLGKCVRTTYKQENNN